VSLIIRKNRKTIVCGAESKPRKGDCYINDDVHYVLAQEMKVLDTFDEGRTWRFAAKKKRKRKKMEKKADFHKEAL